jgi:ribosomal protein L33
LKSKQRLLSEHDIYQPFVETDEWKLEVEDLKQAGRRGERFTIKTPKKSMTMVLEYNKYTAWVRKHLIIL